MHQSFLVNYRQPYSQNQQEQLQLIFNQIRNWFMQKSNVYQLNPITECYTSPDYWVKANNQVGFGISLDFNLKNKQPEFKIFHNLTILSQNLKHFHNLTMWKQLVNLIDDDLSEIYYYPQTNCFAFWFEFNDGMTSQLIWNLEQPIEHYSYHQLLKIKTKAKQVINWYEKNHKQLVKTLSCHFKKTIDHYQIRVNFKTIELSYRFWDQDRLITKSDQSIDLQTLFNCQQLLLNQTEPKQISKKLLNKC